MKRAKAHAFLRAYNKELTKHSKKTSMKKYFYLALVCLAGVTTFIACNAKGKGNDEPDPENEGKWFTAATQIDPTALNDKDNKCWAIDIWCDGTTIGRQFEWGSEAEIAAAAKLILTMDYQYFGYQTKKVKWFEADANDKDACHKLVWEGAICWQETISANGQSETGYGWMPEKNMKERHEYYESKGLKHEYRPADAKDQDSCEKLNPSVDPEDPEEPQDPQEPKDYSNLDSTHYYCWEVTQSAYGMTKTTYHWQTEKVLVMTFDLVNIDYTYKKADAEDEQACNEKEEKEEGEEACWKITLTMYGVSSVSYYWGYEAEAEAQVSGVIQMGGSGSYEKTSASDPDSCHE